MFLKKRNLRGRDFFLAFRQLEFMSHSQKNLQRLKIGRRRKENTSTFFRHSSHKINTTSFSLSLSLSLGRSWPSSLSLFITSFSIFHFNSYHKHHSMPETNFYEKTPMRSFLSCCHFFSALLFLDKAKFCTTPNNTWLKILL